MKNVHVESTRRPRVQVELTQWWDGAQTPPRSAAQVTLTRQGLEIYGWYDSFASTGDPAFLTWEEFDALRETLK